MSKKRKATAAGIFIVILVGIALLTLLFVMFSKPIETAYNVTYVLLDNSTSQQTFNFMYSVWHYWPVAMFIGFLIMGLVLVQRQSSREVY